MVFDDQTMDFANQSLLRRIRVLKTGLFALNRYLDTRIPENREKFEKLARPGTELQLVRNYTGSCNPYPILPSLATTGYQIPHLFSRGLNSIVLDIYCDSGDKRSSLRDGRYDTTDS